MGYAFGMIHTLHNKHIQEPVLTSPDDLAMWAKSTQRAFFIEALEAYRTAARHAGPGVTLNVWWHHDNTFTFEPNDGTKPSTRQRQGKTETPAAALTIGSNGEMKEPVALAAPVRKRMLPID